MLSCDEVVVNSLQANEECLPDETQQDENAILWLVNFPSHHPGIKRSGAAFSLRRKAWGHNRKNEEARRIGSRLEGYTIWTCCAQVVCLDKCTPPRPPPPDTPINFPSSFPTSSRKLLSSYNANTTSLRQLPHPSHFPSWQPRRIRLVFSFSFLRFRFRFLAVGNDGQDGWATSQHGAFSRPAVAGCF
jgi:hypothetical protein